MRILLLLWFFTFSALSNSDMEKIYDKHQTKVVELKNKIQVLELQKKISQLKEDINKTKNNKVLFKSHSKMNKPIQSKKGKNNEADNIDAKLLYMIDNGEVKRYSLLINGKEIELKIDDTYKGWKLNRNNGKLHLTKGKVSYDVR